jgi:glycosyltransferase involved in cell wall biosynthesis
VFNEIRTIQTILNRVFSAPLPCEREVIIVDDASTDGSCQFLTERAHHDPFTFIAHEENKGKGQAIRSAIDAVTGDWVIIQDADLEYNPKDIEALLEPAREGIADAVFGSRFLASRYRRAMYFWHTVANNIITLLSNMLNDLNLTDMETGYKLIRTDILKSLVLRSNSFDIEPELTAKLARWGARIYEVPITYEGRTYAEGKKIFARDACYAVWAIVKYRFFDRAYTSHKGFLTLQGIRHARRYNAWLMAQFAKNLGDEVLEAGSGLGALTEFILDSKRLVCADHEEFFVERLRRQYGHLSNFQVYCADLSNAEQIQVVSENGLFGSVVCINLLEHMEDDQHVLKNLHSLLKPGGKLLLLVPQGPGLFSNLDRALLHHRRYTREDLRTSVGDAGFRVLRCDDFNRAGGLGWRLSGKGMGTKEISPWSIAIFEFFMPLIRRIDKIPYHQPNSLCLIAEKIDTSPPA